MQLLERQARAREEEEREASIGEQLEDKRLRELEQDSCRLQRDFEGKEYKIIEMTPDVLDCYPFL